ncbi:hypothetical protein B0H21DRAFT_757630, partial [Amylocystis lapponica]
MRRLTAKSVIVSLFVLPHIAAARSAAISFGTMYPKTMCRHFRFFADSACASTSASCGCSIVLCVPNRLRPWSSLEVRIASLL